MEVVPPPNAPQDTLHALVQDVPPTWTVCTRAEHPQGTLYPRADCPLLVQNVPPDPPHSSL